MSNKKDHRVVVLDIFGFIIEILLYQILDFGMMF
jgi:hypothetical protein